MAILVDNASIHKSRYTKAFLNERNIPLLLNIPYTPELAPIEKVFLVAKTEYRKRRLRMLLNDEDFDPKQLIKDVLRNLENETLIRIFNEGMMRWH